MITILDFIACATAVALIRWIHKHRHQQRLPPGPPGLPIIGNLYHVPASQPWLKFIEWSREYGMEFWVLLSLSS